MYAVKPATFGHVIAFSEIWFVLVPAAVVTNLIADGIEK